MYGMEWTDGEWEANRTCNVADITSDAVWLAIGTRVTSLILFINSHYSFRLLHACAVRCVLCVLRRRSAKSKKLYVLTAYTSKSMHCTHTVPLNGTPPVCLRALPFPPSVARIPYPPRLRVASSDQTRIFCVTRVREYFLNLGRALALAHTQPFQNSSIKRNTQENEEEKTSE